MSNGTESNIVKSENIYFYQYRTFDSVFANFDFVLFYQKMLSLNRHFMKKSIIFNILFISSFCFAQLSADKYQLIKELSKIDYAESRNIGVGGELSKIYESFENIKSNFDDHDLIFLAKNSSNVLRLYSSLELIRRNNPAIVEIYKYYKMYPLNFKYQSGCVIRKTELSKLIYEEFQTIIETKETLEEAIKKWTKEQQGNEPIKIWEIENENLKKIVTTQFFENFNKIKQIEAETESIKKPVVRL